MRHGVDPRLRRFVLINNALKKLQSHMRNFDDGIGEGGGGEDNTSGGSSDMFLYNTFRSGSLSSIPLSPPTPVKAVKTDASFSDQSPLVEYLEASPNSVVEDGTVTSMEEERVQPAATLHNGIHLGKRRREHHQGEETVTDSSNSNTSEGHLGESDSKRPCKSADIQKLVSPLQAAELDPLPPPVLPSSPTSHLPTTIDFTSVDPSIYDFDTAVLTDAPGGLVGCHDTDSSHPDSPLPSPSSSPQPISFSATDFSTQSSLQSSFSSLSCSVSCPSVHKASLEEPLVLNGCGGNLDHSLRLINEPKLSVLSAESTVMTAVSSAGMVTTTASGVKNSSCSLQALRNNGIVSNKELGSESSLSSLSNGTSGQLSLSPESAIEPDDDLGHIVDLLMT